MLPMIHDVGAICNPAVLSRENARQLEHVSGWLTAEVASVGGSEEQSFWIPGKTCRRKEGKIQDLSRGTRLLSTTSCKRKHYFLQALRKGVFEEVPLALTNGNERPDVGVRPDLQCGG